MSTQYIHFTEAQKEQARHTDLAALLESKGETVKKQGKEYVWRNGSDRITLRGNLWFNHYERVGGDAVDFVRRFYDKDFPSAINFLLGESGGNILPIATVPPKPPKPFVLPPKNNNNRRAYAYLLNGRGIDREVLNAFFNAGLIYESKKHHNAVFVGYNRKGVAVHAHKRGTSSSNTFKGNVESGDPKYSFHWIGTSENIYLFEAPIDMLSFISLHKNGWRNHTYAACCGVSDQVLFQILVDRPNIKKVFLCLDNDKAGQTANKRITDKLINSNIKTEILIPRNKDWNEDILFPEQEEEICMQTIG